MARAKTNADAVRNIRRRANTRIKQLERERKQMAAKNLNTSGIDSTIGTLKDLVNQSKAHKVKGKKIKRLNEQSFKAAETLQNMLPNNRQSNKYKQTVKRRNKIFERKLNLAAQHKGNAMSANDVSLFYKATQQFWQGEPRDKRNEIIMKHLGVDTIEQAYDMVMKDKARIDEIMDKYQWTEEERYHAYITLGTAYSQNKTTQEGVSILTQTVIAKTRDILAEV